jgi:hypothetical protein
MNPASSSSDQYSRSLRETLGQFFVRRWSACQGFEDAELTGGKKVCETRKLLSISFMWLRASIAFIKASAVLLNASKHEPDRQFYLRRALPQGRRSGVWT